MTTQAFSLLCEVPQQVPAHNNQYVGVLSDLMVMNRVLINGLVALDKQHSFLWPKTIYCEIESSQFSSKNSWNKEQKWSRAGKNNNNNKKM